MASTPRSEEEEAKLRRNQKRGTLLALLLLGLGLVATYWSELVGPDERSVQMGTEAGTAYGEIYGAMSRTGLPEDSGTACLHGRPTREEYPELDGAAYCDAFNAAAAIASAEAAGDPSTAIGGADVDQTTPAQPAPTPSAGSGQTCVENCTWTRSDVITDLELILCDADFDMTLSDDVTELYDAVDADQVLLCSAGGSMETSQYGIVYLWDEFEAITSKILEPFAMCDSPGAAVYGGSPGNPGYVIANIQSPSSVTDALAAGGATTLCPPSD